MPGEHKATQQSDEMFCSDCGCRWEVGEDPENIPPCTGYRHPDGYYPDAIVGVDLATGPDITVVYVSEPTPFHGIVLKPGTYELRRVEE